MSKVTIDTDRYVPREVYAIEKGISAGTLRTWIWRGKAVEKEFKKLRIKLIDKTLSE